MERFSNPFFALFTVFLRTSSRVTFRANICPRVYMQCMPRSRLGLRRPRQWSAAVPPQGFGPSLVSQIRSADNHPSRTLRCTYFRRKLRLFTIYFCGSALLWNTRIAEGGLNDDVVHRDSPRPTRAPQWGGLPSFNVHSVTQRQRRQIACPSRRFREAVTTPLTSGHECGC